MPYIDTRSERLPLLLSQYSRALRSQSPGPAIRVLRKSVLESFRSRIVVKFTRGHLSLASAQEAFLFPLIHLTRDPRAIVSSIRMTDWEWLFNHLHVEGQLLQPMAGDTEFFNEWLDIITRYDQNAVHIRIATYWALTEMFLEHSLPSNSSLIKIIQYEQLLEEGSSILVGVLKRLGFDNIKVANLNILNSDSFSTSEERQGATKEDRLAGWKNTLNRNEINDIETLVSDFGLENRFYNGKG